MEKSKYDLGVETFKKVYGDQVPIPDDSQNDAWMVTMMEDAFASVWARGKLDIADLRLVVLGITAALGEQDVFELQCKAAVQNGELTPEQVMELLLFLPRYVGFPRSAGLRARMMKAFPDVVAKP